MLPRPLRIFVYLGELRRSVNIHGGNRQATYLGRDLSSFCQFPPQLLAGPLGSSSTLLFAQDTSTCGFLHLQTNNKVRHLPRCSHLSSDLRDQRSPKVGCGKVAVKAKCWRPATSRLSNHAHQMCRNSNPAHSSVPTNSELGSKTLQHNFDKTFKPFTGSDMVRNKIGTKNKLNNFNAESWNTDLE